MDKAADTLAIEAVEGPEGLRRFLKVPATLYANDPHWVAPLRFERLRHLDPARNPYFARSEVAYWLARRGARPVGRISAQLDRAHLERHRDASGHFGFLEAEDDAEVFEGLCGAAEDWLRGRGMQRILGPFSLSINDESGLLVEGFDAPPCLMMNYAPPYYGPRLEEQGYAKAQDLIAYRYDLEAEPPAAARALIEKTRKEKGLAFRDLKMAQLDKELGHIRDIFNDAWSENWGFVPLSDDDMAYFKANLKPFLTSHSVCFGEIDGEPVAMCVGLPNLNEAIADLGGRLLPFGWIKLLWRLKVRGPRSGRMAMMGVKRRFHGTPLGAGLALGIIERMRRHHRRQGMRWAELSWVLENNRPTRHLIEMMGGQAYKTYRVYEKALT